jgi:ATP-dependent DNA ligase
VFAQLVLPIREHEDKKLKFAGRVGTGFSDKLLRSLYSELENIRIDSCPFFNLPAAGRSRLDPGLTATEMNRPRWVNPTVGGSINNFPAGVRTSRAEPKSVSS